MVCLVQEPSTCKDVKLSYMAQSALTPQQCMMYGQGEIAKWMEGHPKWAIRKWKCQTPREERKAHGTTFPTKATA